MVHAAQRTGQPQHGPSPPPAQEDSRYHSPARKTPAGEATATPSPPSTSSSSPASSSSHATPSSSSASRKTRPRKSPHPRKGLGAPPASPSLLQSSPASQKKLLTSLREELAKTSPDVFVLRHACKVCGVPPEERGQVWKVLLGCQGGGVDAQTSEDGSALHNGEGSVTKQVTLDLSNQRVIRADIERTLPHLPVFQDPHVREEMEQVLTRYCKEHDISYKQGMNYVLAPLYLAGIPGGVDGIYQAYVYLIQAFLPNTFSDSEFGGLQCLFSLFRFLVLYHDPELYSFLEQYDMGPELYASSWFITLHANRLKPEPLLALWDQLLLEAHEDTMLHYFVSLALLISHRKLILHERMVNLPETLSLISIQTVQEVALLVQKAKRTFRALTPNTVRTYLRSITSRKISIDSAEYEHLASMNCLEVSAEEIVSQCYTDSSGRTIKYFVLDCRPMEQYNAGHLPCAFHVDPDLLMQPEQLSRTVKDLSGMRGCHFVFCAEGGGAHTHKSSLAIILYLLQKRFKHISTCEGGYEACHALILEKRARLAESGGDENVSHGGYELVDHDLQRCFECKKEKLKSKASNKGGGFGFFSSLKSQLSHRFPGDLTSPVSPNIALGAAATVTIHNDNSKRKKSSAARALAQETSVPESVVMTEFGFKLRLLHATFRDTTIAPELWRGSYQRLAAMALEQAFDFVDMKEVGVQTAGGGLYTGLIGTPVCAITLTPGAAEAVRLALKPFEHVAAPAYGSFEFFPKAGHLGGADSFTSSSSSSSAAAAAAGDAPSAAFRTDKEKGQQKPKEKADSGGAGLPPSGSVLAGLAEEGLQHVNLPEDIQSRHIFLFVGVVTPPLVPALLSVLRHLAALAVPRANITLVTVVAARPALWSLHDCAAELTVVTTAVDEWRGSAAGPPEQARPSEQKQEDKRKPERRRLGRGKSGKAGKGEGEGEGEAEAEGEAEGGGRPVLVPGVAHLQEV
eukprot:g6238.t1